MLGSVAHLAREPVIINGWFNAFWRCVIGKNTKRNRYIFGDLVYTTRQAQLFVLQRHTPEKKIK